MPGIKPGTICWQSRHCIAFPYTMFFNILLSVLFSNPFISPSPPVVDVYACHQTNHGIASFLDCWTVTGGKEWIDILFHKSFVTSEFEYLFFSTLFFLWTRPFWMLLMRNVHTSMYFDEKYELGILFPWDDGKSRCCFFPVLLSPLL